MQGASTAFKVGLLITAATIGWLFWFFNTSKGRLGGADTIGVHAYFKNANGLSAKSKVTVAGLDVGQIANIRLVNMDAEASEAARCNRIEALRQQGRYQDPPPGEARVEPPCRRGFWARVDLRVKRSFPLYRDATVEKSTSGLLGSNLLELGAGTPTLQQLQDGDEIVNVAWQSGMEAAFSKLGSLEGDFESIIRNINGITSSINEFVGPDPDGAPTPSFRRLVAMLQERLDVLIAEVGKTVGQVNGFIGDNQSNITQTIANLTRVSDELKAVAEGTGERGTAFNQVVANVQEMTEQLRGVVTDLRSLMGGAGEAVAAPQGDGTSVEIAEAQQQVRGLRGTVDRLNDSLDALAEVTSRIAAGEGTVGRLLTDDKIANDLEDAIEGASDLVGGINRIDTHVKVLAWYNFRQGTAHDGISVRLQPRPDKYYLLELMDDPRRVPTYRWTVTQTNDPLHNPDGKAANTTVIEQVAETTDSFRITAMFAKMWGPLTLRVGMLENSGAVGANLEFWERRLRLRSDLYQFGALDRLPRWRSYLELEPIDHVFVVGGVDDVINFADMDYFAGAGISFTDEDLKSLLTVVPTP